MLSARTGFEPSIRFGCVPVVRRCRRRSVLTRIRLPSAQVRLGVRQSKAVATRVPARGARLATRAVTEPEATEAAVSESTDEAPGRLGRNRSIIPFYTFSNLPKPSFLELNYVKSTRLML